ncbi:NAD(P)/FAD-dependent oxidoreductase [Caulobacter sp. S45]|uniref:NAD(P)/FAD-dependent oxidoreductase n=1 Tax=Caulobacter sp. S45 TaxID=1641861 RepID=UPI00131AAA2C|nr:flavin monoamine oxidase family protein [Caulobacter sp. S45]
MSTRRELLMRVAGVTGAAGMYTAARALGLMEGEEAWAGPPALTPGSGKGAKVVILGAGMAGLSAAYELGKAGYSCTVLEARGRTGGRNYTMRGGDVLEMTDGTRQVCSFDKGHYFNAGPARLPSHHQATLGYCREFGVPMEVLVNHSESALIQADDMNGGKPIQMRQASFDTRGHVAELLAKAVRGGGLDAELTKDDRDRLISTLASWGALATGRDAVVSANARDLPAAAGSVKGPLYYNGSVASGYATYPGAGDEVASARKPLPLDTLMHPTVLLGSRFHEFIDMQATMQQPVGGMDAIPRALEAKLGPTVVRKNCEVTRIARHGAGVAVSYRDKATGKTKRVEAEYCLVTIPLKVLSAIPSDFSPDRKAAIDKATYNSAIKIAFQSPRFWEAKDQIYGGLSFTARDTLITWYPSHELHAREGVLVAGYSFGELADRFAALPLAERIAYARGSVERLHPGHSASLKAPITVSWKSVPYSLGIECPLAEQDPASYALLGEADGPFYFAGEHLSHVGAWQQGAIVSGHRAAVMLDARHRQGAPVADVRSQ